MLVEEVSGSVNGKGANETCRVLSQVHQAKKKNSKWGNEQEEHTDNIYGSHVLEQVISYFWSSVVAFMDKALIHISLLLLTFPAHYLHHSL